MRLFILNYMPDFRLKVFRSVARNLSFTKASGELFITQPAITKHIQALEKHYGLRFFNRKGNKINLTPAGKVLFDYTNKTFRLEQALEEELNRFKEGQTGELRLGASTTIAQYVIPGILSEFHKKYPELRLSLLNGNSEQIAEALRNDEIDLGLVEGKVKNKDIRYELFMTDELVAATSSNNNLIKKEEISLKELVKLPLVLRERGSGTLEVLEYAFREKNIKLSELNVLMYLGSTEAIKRFLESDSSIGLLSIRAIENELKTGTLKIIKIKKFKVKRTFNFISLQGNTPSGLLARFIKQSKLFYNQKL